MMRLLVLLWNCIESAIFSEKNTKQILETTNQYQKQFGSKLEVARTSLYL